MVKNNFKNLSLILLTSLSVGIFSCTSSSSNKVDSLKSALLFLAKSDNYTFSYSGSYMYAHDYIFTEKSIGVVCEDDESADMIYVKDKKGVYSLSYNGVAYVGSEYYDYGTELWNNTYAYTLKGACLDYINSLDETTTSLTIKDKEYRLAYLQTMGYTANDYVNMGSLSVRYQENNNEPNLIFKMKYDNYEFTYTCHKFGTSKNNVVDNYLKQGGTAYTPNEVQKTFRELFQKDNYSRSIYYVDEEESIAGYIGYELFNPHYFYTQNLTSSTGSGAIELNCKAVTEGDDPHDALCGCYMYTLTKGGYPSLYPQAVYSVPSIEEYYHYPSQMKLFSSLEYLLPFDEDLFPNVDLQDDTIAYMITDYDLVSDFGDNFSMSDNIDGQLPLALGIEIYLDDNDDELENETQITFYYRFQYEGNQYTFPFPFYSFGISNISTLDLVYDMYND